MGPQRHDETQLMTEVDKVIDYVASNVFSTSVTAANSRHASDQWGGEDQGLGWDVLIRGKQSIVFRLGGNVVRKCQSG